MNRQILGASAEQRAREYLERQGLVFLDNNFRCKGGEIDLVMRHQPYVVFVEVRYRSEIDFLNILESISRAKQQRIILAAWHYLFEQQWVDKVDCRFDVLTLNVEGEFLWIPNAFEVEYH